MQPTTPTIFEEPSDWAKPDESRFAMDNKLYVEFFRKPVLQPGKSREAGRAVYEEIDYVRIHVPGDKSSVVERPVNQQDIFRFQERYNKWKAGQEEAVTGTPLTALPGMNPSKIEEYKFFKLVTVEQLAEANDNLGGKFMSFQQDKQRAKVFLEVAKNNAPIEKMNEELAKRDAELDELRAMITTLQANAKSNKRSVAATPETAE
ncbi:hypothetical protein UFOVP312_40 [uncultured Caudovirales phage]|uniref:Uncharacterized protein n=1 Tax=uncultured Caudovirales phage TaxID=2100421 RepID=A0A6J5LUF7_9CAUD|nr:hypothetical protein UFOVP312_40 [uncultured Caudovirales phage]